MKRETISANQESFDHAVTLLEQTADYHGTPDNPAAHGFIRAEQGGKVEPNEFAYDFRHNKQLPKEWFARVLEAVGWKKDDSGQWQHEEGDKEE